MTNRREFFRMTAGAGASPALGPQPLRALQEPGGALVRRVVPSSRETLPVIGLRRGNDSVDRGAFREVLEASVDDDGRVLDAVHDTAGVGEQVAATVANELGTRNRVFWSLRGTVPGPPQPGPAGLRARIQASFARRGPIQSSPSPPGQRRAFGAPAARSSSSRSTDMAR